MVSTRERLTRKKSECGQSMATYIGLAPRSFRQVSRTNGGMMVSCWALICVKRVHLVRCQHEPSVLLTAVHNVMGESYRVIVPVLEIAPPY